MYLDLGCSCNSITVLIGLQIYLPCTILESPSGPLNLPTVPHALLYSEFLVRINDQNGWRKIMIIQGAACPSKAKVPVSGSTLAPLARSISALIKVMPRSAKIMILCNSETACSF